jgi:hypothetical protein
VLILSFWRRAAGKGLADLPPSSLPSLSEGGDRAARKILRTDEIRRDYTRSRRPERVFWHLGISLSRPLRQDLSWRAYGQKG